MMDTNGNGWFFDVTTNECDNKLLAFFLAREQRSGSAAITSPLEWDVVLELASNFLVSGLCVSIPSALYLCFRSSTAHYYLQTFITCML